MIRGWLLVTAVFTATIPAGVLAAFYLIEFFTAMYR